MQTIGSSAFGRIALAGMLLLSVAAALPAKASAHPGLTAFSSEAELQRYLTRLKHRTPPPPPAPPPPMAMAGNAVAESAPATTAPSITNNQVQGVDEGDIVKQHGDTLVILRRGKLFTVSLARGGMKPVDSINAFPPGVDASGD